MLPLDDAQLYRALLARDARFDGLFFVAVTSTRIYCRPICPAPNPHPERCRFFTTAAAAERRGYRPCLRCRPELAPGVPPRPLPGPGGEASVDAVARLARLAAARIGAGALDEAGGMDRLADQLDVTSRHLRRSVLRELGVTPVELAQTRRLLMAKQLLADTDLPLSRIALASGFRSVRRFNALFAERYRLAPGDVRRRTRAGRAGADVGTSMGIARRPGRDGALREGAEESGGTISLTLAFRPPFDWPAMIAHLAARATPGVESVDTDGRYRRTVWIDGHAGVIAIAHDATRRGNVLRLELSAELLPVLVPLIGRLRRQLDLDADPGTIAAHLGGDPTLAPLVARRPGLRVPGALDGFELALRTVLGQQITVRGATTIAGRLAALVGEPLAGAARDGLSRLPVSAERLAQASEASLIGVGLTRARAGCVLALARAVAGGELPELGEAEPSGGPSAFMRRFRELPGIGAWTAEYVAMRALRWPDAFPAGDLVLRQAMGGISEARLRAASEPWRPWRAYAAQQLWVSR